MKQKILIVEDEQSIVKFINNRLKSDIYDVDIAHDGRAALEKVISKTYDLVTLDIMIPHIDGFEICKRLRKRSKHTLIIMISALDTEEFKEKGYEYGVDDYIAKPFSAKELAIKIKALLKRRDEIKEEKIEQISSLRLKKEEKKIFVKDFYLSLTPSEYLILSTFINNPKKVFSRSELAQLIYDNYLGGIDERGIDSHIYHIRKKLKRYEDKEIIKTVRGMGYRINED